MRGAWLYRRDDPGRSRWLLAPLWLLSLGYGLAARLHRGLYQRGWRRRKQLACKVVSVGSPVVGGAGKTPSAAWLARELHRRGTKVALATRGYRRRGREAVRVVSDGRHVRGDAESGGDEPLLLAAHAPGVPVLVGPDRGVVGLRAVSAFGADVVVLDDGFQHHRLARNLDLIVIDGGLGLGNGCVLPRGPLREPVAALRRADAILVVDGPLPEEDVRRLAELAPEAPRFAARRTPLTLRPLAGGAGERPASLHECDVGMLAGIANPDSLRRSLAALGARVVAERCFPDHHGYRPTDVSGLAEEAPLWVTTEKDAVKILPAWVGDADVRVLVIELHVVDGERLLSWVESRLR
jgi:tetraacyldisaccharide 4'-kinase